MRLGIAVHLLVGSLATALLPTLASAQLHPTPLDLSHRARQRANADVFGITPDGSEVLVARGRYPGFQHSRDYERVSTRTLQVLATHRSPVLPQLPVAGYRDAQSRARFRAPSGLEQDLARTGALWAPFRTRHHLFTASPSVVVFGVGDALFWADHQGRQIRPLSQSAGARPIVSSDGRSLVWREHVALGGDYALFYSPLPNVRRVALPETHFVQDFFEFSADSHTLYTISRARGDRSTPLCLRAVALQPPYTSRILRCVPVARGDSHNLRVVFSPSRLHAVVTIRTPPRQEILWMELPSGRISARFARDRPFRVEGVMDDGLALANFGPRSALIDPDRRALIMLAALTFSPGLYNIGQTGNRLVFALESSIAVVDPRQWWTAGRQEPW